MKKVHQRRRLAVWFEWVALLVMVSAFMLTALTAITQGYLPQPFYFMPDDTFMDWFNTAWWARDPGKYDVWLTVYPPLSFVILKLAGLPICYAGTDIGPVRDCDWIGIFVLHAVFVLNIFLTAKTFMKIDRATALQRSVALTAGMPMLFGLERGNLAILCYTFVLLGFGPLIKSARIRWAFVGLAVNLKIYLIAGVAAQLLRRRWRWFEGCLIATLLIYLISFAVIGSGSPIEIYDNLVNFAVNFKPDAVAGAYYPNNYNALRYALTDPSIPVHLALDSRTVQLGAWFVTAVLIVTELAIVAAAAATFLRPEVVPPYRVTLLGLAFAMVATETGSYTAPMMLLLVFMERWRGIARPVAIVSAYILCIPGDIPMAHFSWLYRFSYLGNKWVLAEQFITLGMFVRPFLFSVVPISLAFATIHDVYVDVRDQGWRDRRWLPNDAPLLPGIIGPRALQSHGYVGERG